MSLNSLEPLIEIQILSRVIAAYQLINKSTPAVAEALIERIIYHLKYLVDALNGSKKQYLGTILGLCQLTGGAGLAIFSDRKSTAVIGGALINAGINGVMCSLTTSEEELSIAEYVKESVVGGMTGLASRSILGLAQNRSVFFKAVIYATSGMGSRATDNALRGIIKGETPSESLSSINWRSLLPGATTGIINGFFNVIGSDWSRYYMNICESRLSAIISGALCEGIAGTIGGAVSKVVDNAIVGKELSDDITTEMSINGSIGLLMGGMSNSY